VKFGPSDPHHAPLRGAGRKPWRLWLCGLVVLAGALVLAATLPADRVAAVATTVLAAATIGLVLLGVATLLRRSAAPIPPDDAAPATISVADPSESAGARSGGA